MQNELNNNLKKRYKKDSIITTYRKVSSKCVALLPASDSTGSRLIYGAAFTKNIAAYFDVSVLPLPVSPRKMSVCGKAVVCFSQQEEMTR